VTGRDVRVAASTIARWYYTALRQPDDPVGALRRAVRQDCGKIALAAALAERLDLQYRDHPDWSYQLHYDNLAALVKADPSLGRLPSYSTIKRSMQAHGWARRPRLRPGIRPGEAQAETRRQTREIRSYEATHVGALWHLDFHHGSLKVLTAGGQWLQPIALGILDDHSRLCCHVQWYLSETAEDLVHGLSQSIQKRGLPRALLTDNGSAMVAEEVTEGLLRLGIVHERTLPYSPYQNGKQEAFWGTLEGRLMKMLDGVADLTLELLNEATQAWVEIEYNRTVHRETSCSPVERFAQAPDVLRTSPASEALRNAFRLETKRSQRQSDGTISLEGRRFEIPARYRHFREVTVRYARWDLGRIDLVDGRSGIILAPIYPLDKAANAEGRRAVTESVGIEVPSPERQSRRAGSDLPPLLKRILQEYSATGMPPAYLPKTYQEDSGESS
jgi:transposase InsO family protein